MERKWLSEQLPIIESMHRSSRRGRKVDLVVWHWTGGRREAQDVARRDYRSSRKVSAHFTIGRDGLIVQSVPLTLAAWHAGGSRFQHKGWVNQRSIGVEVCNVGYHRSRHDGKGIPWVRADHPNPRSHKEYWERYTDHQELAIETLVFGLEDIFGPMMHTGHEDVRNSYAVPGVRGGRTDPGPLFPWDKVNLATRGGVYRFNYTERDWYLTLEAQ